MDAVRRFGDLDDGREVGVWRLGSKPGPVVEVLDLGAAVHRLEVRGADGRRRNVVLGHRTAQDYLDGRYFLGAVVGRYANRIRGGRFDLQGEEVQVGVNDRGNQLHGGPDGFHRRTWTVMSHDASTLALRLLSEDGDQGFPGNLEVTAVYAVSDCGLTLDLAARSDKATIVNLTSHVYLNLDGNGSGPVDDHLLHVAADRYLPVDATGIPTGPPLPVEGTPFDLRRPARLGAVVRADHPQIVEARGVDHDFLLSHPTAEPAVTLTSTTNGTVMRLFCDQPGLQVYTGNFLNGSTVGSDAASYRQGDGIALEPQRHPDTPNRPDLGSAVLLSDETYMHSIHWCFREEHVS